MIQMWNMLIWKISSKFHLYIIISLSINSYYHRPGAKYGSTSNANETKVNESIINLNNENEREELKKAAQVIVSLAPQTLSAAGLLSSTVWTELLD